MSPMATDWHRMSSLVRAPRRSHLVSQSNPLDPSGPLARVSVVIPCFNYGHWLVGCVESALTQEQVDVDVIIVNDASTDHSGSVADQLAARDSRVRVIHHVTNKGHIPSVNEGLAATTGEYIVKLDADDLLTSGSIARSVALLKAHPNVGFVYGRCLYFGAGLKQTLNRSTRLIRSASLAFTDAPASTRLSRQVRHWTLWPGHEWLAMRCERGVNCISQPEVVMRAAAIRVAGGYDEKLPHTSDLGMWLTLAGKWDVGHIDGPIQGLYRVHAGSMQRTVNAGKLRDLNGRLDAFESVLSGMATTHSHAQQYLDIARRRLASEALESACRAFDRGRTHLEPVDDYVTFAENAYPEATRLPEWVRLSRRRRAGSAMSRFHPVFFADAVLNRVREEASMIRWWHTGV